MRHDPDVLVWALTRVEVVSAIRRKEREGSLTRREVQTALRRADRLFARCHEVQAFESVRERAERLLAVHPLTAADALQLASALVGFRERPRGRAFVTADAGLAAAAETEGFDAMRPAS